MEPVSVCELCRSFCHGLSCSAVNRLFLLEQNVTVALQTHPEADGAAGCPGYEKTSLCRDAAIDPASPMTLLSSHERDLFSSPAQRAVLMPFSTRHVRTGVDARTLV